MKLSVEPKKKHTHTYTYIHILTRGHSVRIAPLNRKKTHIHTYTYTNQVMMMTSQVFVLHGALAP